MTVPVTIEPYGAADDLDSRDLDRVVAIFNETWAEWVPGERPISAAAYCDDERFTHPPEVALRRLARDERGEVVGMGRVEFREEPEPGACALKVFVAAGARGRGVGTALGAALADAAREAGRTGVTVEAREGTPAGEICKRAGLTPDMVVEMNRAPIDAASDDLLTGWVAAGEAVAGYSLVAYDGSCPAELAAAFVEARHVMNDAPRWEGEPPSEFTVEELRAAEEAAVAANIDWWNVGVRHDASGAIVGLSEVYLKRARPWIAFQGDTGVDPAHRGHGLGAWMKAVNHLRLRAERPQVEVVSTWNASANAPMLRINRALGFRPAATYQGWFLPFG